MNRSVAATSRVAKRTHTETELRAPRPRLPTPLRFPLRRASARSPASGAPAPSSRHSPRGIAMECLTASFAARNACMEYKFVCPSKPACEKQWIPGRVLCYFTAYTNSSRRCKVATGVCPVSPVVGRRSRWRSFAASLNLENGPAPSSSTSSSSGQASEQLTSAELKSLLADKERSKLLRKLSEANQLNRFLKRQVLLLKS
uniref:Uncharacterized protein n=1 Tax=Triticum urartu TaxID=4572 RepID=A0A8R7QKP4_TRIUA